jgi:ATP-dependent Lon protease
LPLRNSVLFPGSIIPIDVGRPKSVKLVEEAIANERPIIGIVTQREARVEEPTSEADLHSGRLRRPHPQGHQAREGQLQRHPPGRDAHPIEKIVATEPFLRAASVELPDPGRRRRRGRRAGPTSRRPPSG